MGRIWGARKPVKRLRNTRFWAWYLQHKRRSRSTLSPCLTDLIGWFKFDTQDNEGKTELVNSVGTSSPPSVQKGQSLLFSGVEHVATGVSPSTNLESGRLSLYLNHDSTNPTGLQGMSDNVNRLFIGPYQGKLVGGLGGDSVTNIASGVSLVNGTTYKIAMEWDGTNVWLEIDDVEVFSKTQNGNPVGSNLEFFLGGINNGSGVAFPSTGKVWDVRLTDKNGELVLFTSGTQSDDANVPSYPHGVAVVYGAVIDDFYYEHTDGDGFDPNVLGYTDDDGSILPANPSNTSLDIAGNTLQFPTPKLPISVHGFAGTWNGTAKITASHLVGTEVVTDSDGTSTPTVSAGEITFTAGWCSFVELDNGDYFVIESSETSNQTSVYNKGNAGDDGVLSSAVTPFFTTEVEHSTLAQFGFEKDGDDYIPAGASSTLTAEPNTFEALEPCVLNAPDSPAWINADATLSDFWFTSGVPNDIDPADIEDINDQQLINTDTALTIASEDQTGDCLGDTNSYLGKSLTS